MAGKGTYGAYRALKPVGAEITQNIQHQERMGFHYRREEREKKESRNKLIREIAKKKGVDEAALQIDKSGVEGVDAPTAQYLIESKATLDELAAQMIENPDDYEAYLKYEKINNRAKTIKAFSDKYGGKMTKLDQGLQPQEETGKPKYSAWLNRNVKNKLNNNLLKGRFKFFDDKDGKLNMFVDYDQDGEEDKQVDVDGDGKIDHDFNVIDVEGFVAGINVPEFQPYYDLEGAVNDFSDDYGTADIKTEEGYTTTREKGFDKENIPKLQQDVEMRFGESVEKMTPEAQAILADDLGYENPLAISEEQFKIFKNNVVESVVKKVDRVYEETFDQGAQNSAINTQLRKEELEYRKQKDALDQEGKKDPEDDDKKGVGSINVVTTEDGEYKDASGAVNFTIRGGIKIDDSQVYGFKVKDGEVVLRGKRPTTFQEDPVNSGKTKTEYLITDDTEIADFIVKVKNPETGEKFKNLTEFNKYAKKLENQYGNAQNGLGDPNNLPDVEL
jgi:hypothetical protein